MHSKSVMVFGDGVWGRVVANKIRNDIDGLHVGAVFDVTPGEGVTVLPDDAWTRQATVSGVAHVMDVWGAIVCVPDYQMLDVFKLIMVAGIKRVWLEKPCGVTLRMVELICEFASDHGISVYCNNPIMIELKKRDAMRSEFDVMSAVWETNRESGSPKDQWLDLAYHPLAAAVGYGINDVEVEVGVAANPTRSILFANTITGDTVLERFSVDGVDTCSDPLYTALCEFRGIDDYQPPHAGLRVAVGVHEIAKNYRVRERVCG